MLVDCKSIKHLHKRGEANSLVYMETAFPWPFKDRDMVFHYAGVADYTNHAFLTVSKSLRPGTNYFGTVVPGAKNGNERMDFKHMFNYFQYLGPNKTRFIQILNVDPKIKILPKSLLESLTKK